MVALSFELMWGPGVIGVGQYIFYLRAFPHDKYLVKALVFIMLFLLYDMRVLNDISTCHPRELIYWITLIVQGFYAHRVWIISGQNKVITSAVIVSATLQLLCTGALFRSPTFDVLFGTEWSPISAIASAISDAIITLSVFYYLQPARTGIIRNDNYIKQLNDVFVQMGLFSFINALAMVVLYYIQDEMLVQFLTAAPGVILSKTYVNSMLAV
ncbi:hypothetical protein HYDPIDRAFT_169810 [Hydnomerulius pinastri MD-312]|uniref:DUF6534 domain-containing protein n=1 Tax=Hydnomerulius pinastri MD-312 TaxID=994086 RepID=A0A0C9VTF8_9AGAM|nr:hypothetical protein HYDPIDRAFT_169810 [Hydnomerulius pinastri MD-312]